MSSAAASSNGLCQRRRKRPRTTNSNHNYFIYPDLLNTSPKLKAVRFGQLCVTDITYVATSSGWAYLSLVTDAAARLIVGWDLHPTLAKAGPLKSIGSAMDFYRQHGVNLSSLIHHSDRGVQYCCNEYVDLLKRNGIRISMTQTGDPLHNALAERMNNTVKNGWLFDTEDKGFEFTTTCVPTRLWGCIRRWRRWRDCSKPWLSSCRSQGRCPLPRGIPRCFS